MSGGPKSIVSEFFDMALQDDPDDREINMTVSAALMSPDERARARQAARDALMYLDRAVAAPSPETSDSTTEGIRHDQ